MLGWKQLLDCNHSFWKNASAKSLAVVRGEFFDGDTETELCPNRALKLKIIFGWTRRVTLVAILVGNERAWLFPRLKKLGIGLRDPLMATTTSSHPVYVQQSFSWDLPDSSDLGIESSQGYDGANSIHGFETNSGESGTQTVRRVVRPSTRKPVTVPSIRQSSSVRRGRCEHVGGILASVLEKYGIGIDQLIAEIDGK